MNPIIKHNPKIPITMGMRETGIKINLLVRIRTTAIPAPKQTDIDVYLHIV
jgi:hypothetical protein